MAWFTLPPSGNAVPIGSLLRSAPRGGANGAGEGTFADLFTHRSATHFTPQFAARLGVDADHVLLTSSGAASLWLALRSLRSVEPRRTAVAVPAWCCPSVPAAVMLAGLDPIAVDVDPSSLRYDTEALLTLRDRGLLAVVLVHFFGLPQPRPPGDWDGAAFIRDCAQDFEYRPVDGVPCFYSFGRGKALNAGHGGALVMPPGPWRDAAARLLTRLPRAGDRVKPKAIAINLLSEPHLYWALSRLPLGLGKTEWHAVTPARPAADFEPVAAPCMAAYESRLDYYRALIAGYRGLIAACDGDRITAPTDLPTNWMPGRFPVLVRDARLRETLFREMSAGFGGVTRMYPAPLNLLPGAPAGFAEGEDFPGARRVAAEILTLPVTAELRGREDALMEGLAGILDREGALRTRARAYVRRSALD